MAVDITFRTDGPWGTGKGSPLNKGEVDNNFWSLKQAVEDLIDNPLEPLQIHDITVSGNQMTITLSDLTTTFGPYTLPVAAFRWTDSWQANHDYKAWDLFVEQDGMYLVLQDHTSGSTFDPDASNVNGRLYQLIFPYPNSYQFGFFFPGQPGLNITVERPIFMHVFAKNVVLPAGLVGSEAVLIDPPALDLSFDIMQNGTTIGSINFTSGQTVGTFTFAADVAFEPGDSFKVIRPLDIDDLALDLSVTFAGKVSSLS